MLAATTAVFAVFLVPVFLVDGPGPARGAVGSPTVVITLEIPFVFAIRLLAESALVANGASAGSAAREPGWSTSGERLAALTGEDIIEVMGSG